MSRAAPPGDLSRDEKLALIAKLLAEQPQRPRGFPLSFAQQRLWFVDQAWPRDPFYNLPTAVHLSGALNHRALEWALTEIVRRHESLRTTFVDGESGPLQMIVPARPVALPVIEIGGDSDRERRTRMRRLLEEHAREPFDLSRGPLIRATLFRSTDRESWLLVTLHHIVSDAWSIAIFFRELAVLYESALTRRPSSLPELSIQYVDYTQWQRQTLQGDVLAQHLAYWREQVGGPLPVLDLPTDHPRPPSPTHRGAHVSFKLGRPLCNELRGLGQREGLTLFMVLLAGLAVLLHRYSGQQDIVIGTPVANRQRTELEPLIGFFVNTLPLRIDLAGDPSFREVLARVRETTLGAYAHQDLPFEKLVEDLRPRRDISRAPFFQVMLILHSAPRDAPLLPGLELTFVDVEHHTAKFDLLWSIVERATELDGLLEYSTDLFEPGTVDRLIAHWETLLDAAVTNPDRRVSRIPLLSATAREQVVRTWNQTAVDSSADASLAELFATQATRTPDAVAVACDDEVVSYAALHARVQRLATHLRRLGVGPERVVALCLERSVDLVVALLGVLDAGGAYLPLDPEQPPARVATVLADAGAAVWITDREWRRRLPAYDGAVVYLDAPTMTDAPAANVAAEEPHGARGDQLADVIYTSGSTGRPKGVAITQRAAVNCVTALRTQLDVTATDVVLALTTISFDIALLELYLPLTVGARVVIASREAAADGRALQMVLQQQAATVLQATPTTWRLLLEAGWTGAPLRQIWCGGEALPRSLADALLATGRPVWNLYGPTETTVWSTAARVEPGSGPVSIGRPIANTQVYVVDEVGEPVPVGLVGELVIGGAGLARAYVGQAAQTATAFVPDPFATIPGARLYRTGDLARWRAEGQLECLGRRDQQVKLQGHRIELGEIEAALARHPEVRQTAVALREDGPERARLVAYVVRRSPHIVDAADEAAPILASCASPRPDEAIARELLETLRGQLPASMIPSAIVFLDRLPVSAHGKLDRRALPAPPAPSVSAAPPRTPEEQMLCALFAEVLGLERVGVADNFFELGGHSLLASRLATRVRATLGVDLAVRTLFEAPSVSQLATRLDPGESTRDGLRPLLRLRARGVRPPLFCLAPAGGVGWSYAALMRVLDPERPIHALQTFGVTGDAPLPRSVDAAADDFIAIVRDVQPQGPYHLLGWSFGGLLAHAMACRLQQQHQQIALLAVLDAYPATASASKQSIGSLSRDTRIGTPPPSRAHVLADAELERMSTLIAHAATLAAAYAPARVDGDLLLFTAAGQRRYASSWQPYVTGAVISHEIHCAHLDMMSPGPLDAIGRTLEAHLRRHDHD
jgi:amino acid adenylation domain-containing protein